MVRWRGSVVVRQARDLGACWPENENPPKYIPLTPALSHKGRGSAGEVAWEIEREISMKVVSVSLRAAALGLALAASCASAQQKVLKFIPQADLRILDPIATTAYITRNHGYMVYDTLFATDANFKIQPQMVDKWELSKDKLTYTFTLRDGLKFHDGQPVRSVDCIASLERWSKRDVFGQKLAEMTDAWTAVNDKTFSLKLKKPFAYVLDALGKPSSNVPFIVPLGNPTPNAFSTIPEPIGSVIAVNAITDPIGSGPFKM